MVLCVAANGKSAESGAETTGSRAHVQVCLFFVLALDTLCANLAIELAQENYIRAFCYFLRHTSSEFLFSSD